MPSRHVRIVGVTLIFFLILVGAVTPVLASSHTAPQRVQPPPSYQLVINEILFLSTSSGERQLIEIANLGGSVTRIRGWYLCNRMDCWRFPRFTIQPGGFVTVHLGVSGDNTSADLFAPELDGVTITADEIALFSSVSNRLSSAMVDFVAWGSPQSGETRMSVAISARQWQPGKYVDVSILEAGKSISYEGPGDDADSWTVGLPTIGSPNGQR